MFYNPTLNTSEGATVLNKALSADYGTNAATYVNGHALLKEDCETTVLSVLKQQARDWKLMSSLKKTPMRQTVHQVIRRTSEGDYRYTATGEGAPAHETNQELDRLIVLSKYIQSLRGVTKQMELSETYEIAKASETLAGINTILKACEYYNFHGDSETNDCEYDGFVTVLTKSAKEGKTASLDLRGEKLSSANNGETTLNEIARLVYDRGGFIDKVFFPPAIAGQFYDLFKERMRYLQGTTTNGNIPGLTSFTTSIGSVIKFFGDDTGPDKFFQVRGEITAAGDSSKRPSKPTLGTATAADASGVVSHFASSDEDKYVYTVHAMNEFGCSEASDILFVSNVAKGQTVKFTITKGSGATPTGYIICRSKKGDAVSAGESATTTQQATANKSTKTMEIAKIKAGEAAVTFEDTNETLPGTADMIFLPEHNGLESYYDFGQLMPVSTIPMYPTNTLVTPFIVATFGSLVVKAPEFCGIIRNVGV